MNCIHVVDFLFYTPCKPGYSFHMLFVMLCGSGPHTKLPKIFSFSVRRGLSSSEFDCVSHSKEISQTFSAFVQHFFHGILCKIVCVCV